MQVAKYLGEALCEYDEYTFDYVLTSEAIRSGLKRCDLFVFFLSENSIQSPFVNEELRTALELRSAGRLKKVLVIALDQTSYTQLPEWMRSINVATKLSNPLTIGRKIEAELLALDAENENQSSIYIPREAEERLLRQHLRRPVGEAPVSIHSVGYIGMGRKTFIKKCLSEVYPRQIKTFLIISIAKFEGPEEFYRRAYEYFKNSSIEDKIDDFSRFSSAEEALRNEILSDLIAETVSNEELILIDDQGGVYTDEGTYQPYLERMINELKGAPRPVIAFIQSRMMPQRFRDAHHFSCHILMPPLDEEKITDLVSFYLKDLGIDYNAQDLRYLTSLLDGSPINVKLAITSIKNYGLEPFLANPDLLLEWKKRRAEDFLTKIEFSTLERDIIALLVEYRYAPFSVIRQTIKASVEEITLALRRLEEFCCIERRGRIYLVSTPIHDACGRDKRFKKSDQWKREAASIIVDSLDEYKDDENIPITLVELAAKASIKTKKKQKFASVLILPSYFVYLAREAYQEDKRGQAIEFCKKAYDLKNAMTPEAKIEVLRIWGLSSVRIGEQQEIDYALQELEKLSFKKSARQHSHFIKGFAHRFKRKYEEAEEHFIAAHRLAPKSYNINRELANLYRHQKAFVEAEGYARAAFDAAPTNPFVIDVLLECLLGKSHLDLAVDRGEIEFLFEQLEQYGDVPGSSFFRARRAQDFLRARNKPEALRAANKALDRTPEHIPCYFLRGDVLLSMNDAKAARKDFNKINELLLKRGGFSEEDEGRVVELEIGILMAEGDFKSARERLKLSQFIPQRVAKRLLKKLAMAISFEPEKADIQSREWAKKYTAR